MVLREQLLVLGRKSQSPKRASLSNIDRLILVWLSSLCDLSSEFEKDQRP